MTYTGGMNPRHRKWLMFGLLTAVYGWGSWVLADRYLHPNVPPAPLPAKSMVMELPPTQTPAWVTPGLAAGNPKGDVVFVFAHGYGGHRAFWGALFAPLEWNGYECIAPSMPGHDGSPIRQCGFGVTEAEIVLDAVRWVRAQYRDRQPTVVAVGVSLGGAAVWLASEMAPELIDAVATEAAFAHLRPAVHSYLNATIPMGSILLWPVPHLTIRRGQVPMDDIDPERAARAWRGRPALIIHDGNDRIFDRSHAERLAAASGGELWEVAMADHASAQVYDADGYVRRLIQLAKLARSNDATQDVDHAALNVGGLDGKSDEPRS